MLSQEDKALAAILLQRGVLSPQELAEVEASRGVTAPHVSLAEFIAHRSVGNTAALGSSLASSLPKHIGEFEIIREIGRGGMGIVYEAIQTSLNRRVALKLLLNKGPRQEIHVERFAREARAIARLRHPNIVTVHATGESDGSAYIAMDLVKGECLETLVQQGPMEPERAARIGIAIASALDAAHEAGLVHRDIKPSNVLLDEDGSPKLSDFGLVHDTSAARVTLDASVLGTPSFMSPEQARGEAPKPEHDVYSLGAVLYALLGGRAPYDGDIPSAVLSQVLTLAPTPIAVLRPGTPAALAAIVDRALERRPADRYQTAAELADELQRYLDGSATLAEKRARSRRLSRALWAVAPLALAVIGIVGLFWTSSFQNEGGKRAPPASVESPLPMKRITSVQGVEMSPSLAPDGGQLVYASEADGDWDLYIDIVGSGKPRNVTADTPEADTQPAFSPDGRAIAFRSEREGGGIFVLEIASGSAHRVLDFGFHPSWSPDGRLIAVSTESVLGVGRAPRNFKSEVWVLDLATGKAERVIEADAVQPSWSPNGERLAFWGKRDERTAVWTSRRDGAGIRECVAGGSSPRDPAWLADGSGLLLTSRRTGVSDLWAIPFDESSGSCAQEGRIVAHSTVETHQTPAPSRDGRWIAVVNWVRRENATRVSLADRGQAAVYSLTGDTRVESAPDASPDGMWIALTVQDGPSDLVLIRTDASDRRNLTQDDFEERTPRWSPDGQWIAFAANRTGNFEIWRIRPDGTESERLTETGEGSALSPVWSPDGGRLVYGVRGQGILEIDPSAAAPRTPRVVLASNRLRDPDSVPRAWSPDGRWLLLVGRERHASLLDLRTGVESVLPVRAQGGAWTATGELWITDGSELKALEPVTGASRILSTVAPRKFSAALSIDRRTGDAYTTVVENESDIWLMDLTGADRAGALGAPER